MIGVGLERRRELQDGLLHLVLSDSDGREEVIGHHRSRVQLDDLAEFPVRLGQLVVDEIRLGERVVALGTVRVLSHDVLE